MTEHDRQELLEKAEEMENDPTQDLDSTARQEEGWFKVYIECPECETPMARTTTESEGRSEGDLRVSESEVRGVCPNCGKTEVHLQVRKLVGPFGYTFPEVDEDA